MKVAFLWKDLPWRFDVINFFPEFDADNGGVESKKDRQRQGYPLDDDPGHEAVKTGLNQAGPDLLDLEGVDQPLGHVEQKEENRDLAAGHYVFLVAEVFL